LQKKLKLIIKILFILFAFYIIFSKIDILEVIYKIEKANSFYLFYAFLLFNLSKIVSSIRLNYYFENINIKISFLYGLNLYYIGMFYNLFLPSGIGGDGYKIYILNKINKNVKIKDIIQATFLDRISGLIPLIFLGSVLFFMSDFYNISQLIDIVIAIILFLLFPILYIFIKIFFKNFINIFFKTTIIGVTVQVLQILSAIFIIFAIHQELHLYTFLTLFLISSVISIIPISMGGVGLREISFLYGLDFLTLDSSFGVTFAILFFCITAISSFVGIFLKHDLQN
jgi:uncharacterized membrane protein YbhN (UPF0104 family)